MAMSTSTYRYVDAPLQAALGGEGFGRDLLAIDLPLLDLLPEEGAKPRFRFS